MIKNKRGIFFTSLVLLILTLFLLSYTFFTQINERKTIQKRVETMNGFINSLEKDVPRLLKASGFRITLLFENRIIETGNPIDDIQTRFNETFFTGKVYGESTNETDELLEGMTFDGITEAINIKAQKINARVIISNATISVSQTDPWNIRVALDADYSIQDITGSVSWNKTTPYVAYISVEGFEDPIYPIQTNDPAVINKINITPYILGFNTNAELTDHAEKSYYLKNSDAPSFLHRMEGLLSPPEGDSCCGIESLVAGALKNKGLISERSIVDHEYFSGTSGQQVSGEQPSWFLIDSDHTSTYIV